MTRESEQEDAPPSADPANGPEARGPLPSIIVDPQLGSDRPPAEKREPPTSASATPQTDAANGSAASAAATRPVEAAPTDPVGEEPRVDGGASQPPASSEAAEASPNLADADAESPTPGSGDDGSKADLELSAFEADRFAASYRASWEPSTTPPAPPVQASLPPGPSSHPAPATPVAPEPEDDALDLPGTRSRQRAMLLTGAAVLGFGVLVALGLSSGKPHDQKPAWSNGESAAGTASPGDPNPEPAAAPATPRTAEPAAPVDEPAAAAPAEAEAEAEASPEATAIAAEANGESAEAATEAGDEGDQAEPAGTELPAAEPPPPAPAGIEMVHVRVETDPPDATLLLDGKPIANPFDTDVPRSGEHRVEARAPGHVSRALTVDFASDRRLELKLKRRPARAARRARPAPRKPRAHPAPSKSTGAGFVSEDPY